MRLLSKLLYFQDDYLKLKRIKTIFLHIDTNLEESNRILNWQESKEFIADSSKN